MKTVTITKASGEQVPFEEAKLRHSLQRVGASEADIDMILREIEAQLYEGISTRKIYRKAFQMLKQRSRSCAARYKLKEALAKLGPSGYPFEQYVGEIMRYQGYTVQVGVIMRGHCVEHEVDVLAEKDDRRIAIECKFGNSRERKINVKVPLYIRARFEDLRKAWQKEDGPEERNYQAWVVTNAAFSGDAIQYGNCAGLRLVGWSYPRRGSLKDMIDISRLYPVTTLISLTEAEKNRLLKHEIVLCRELQARPELLNQLEIPRARRRKIEQELDELCH